MLPFYYDVTFLLFKPCYHVPIRCTNMVKRTKSVTVAPSSEFYFHFMSNLFRCLKMKYKIDREQYNGFLKDFLKFL